MIQTTPAKSPVKKGARLPLSNQQVAEYLDEIAQLLNTHEANPYRIRAYKRCANALRNLNIPVYEIIQKDGIEALIKIPTIGESLARSIKRLTLTGKLGLLERLRGENNPEVLFMTVAGIGSGLAHRIHEVLGIETLEELEAAAHDGRLSKVEGMGRKRMQEVKESLSAKLSHGKVLSDQTEYDIEQPSIAELLDVDDEYNRRVKEGDLPVVAPSRFNPSGHAWLPVLHTHRANRHYTVLFSNTAHAHKLKATHDWVVIYRDDQGGHGQWTVITSKFGPTKGMRIIRGLESECDEFYSSK